MKNIIALILILLSSTIFAAVYVTHTDNSMEFSDTPSENGKPIDLPSVNSITTPQPRSGSTNAPSNQTSTPATTAVEPARTAASYKTFQITSPKEGENIRNQPTVPVTMNIEPNMLPGDKIQLMLDGKAAGTPSSSIYQELAIVERGAHSISGVIIDKNGTTIKQSNTVSFFVHRNSLITSPLR
jgi:hypothetical protein